MEIHKVFRQSLAGHSVPARGNWAQGKFLDVHVVLGIITVFQHISVGCDRAVQACRRQMKG